MAEPQSFARNFASWPGLLAWITELGSTPDEVEQIYIHADTRIKTQDEVNWSGYNELAYTGLVDIIITIGGQQRQRTFTASELEGR